MWHLMIAAILLPFIHLRSNNRVFKNLATQVDTFTLFKKDTIVSLGKNKALLHFKINQNEISSKKLKILLVLKKVSVISMPEGIYAVYFIPNIKNTSRGEPFPKEFVSLLDLYSLTAPGSEKTITVDLTNSLAVKKNNSQNFIMIRFEGIKSLKGKKNANAGKLIFKGYEIIGLHNPQ